MVVTSDDVAIAVASDGGAMVDAVVVSNSGTMVVTDVVSDGSSTVAASSMVVDDGPTVDDGESMEVSIAELMPEVVPELQQLLHVAPPVVAQVEPVQGVRARKRKEEDELLLRYESMRGACQNARTELSTAIGMPIGTLDGVLSRARKRRSLEPVA